MKTNNIPFLILFAGLLLANLGFNSCKENHIHGPGKSTVEIRQLERFNSIVVFDDIELHMRFGSFETPRAEITGGENLIPFVLTEVENGVLTISNKNKWNWIRNIEKSKTSITIWTDSINHVLYSGVEPLVFDDTLHVKDFVFES